MLRGARSTGSGSRLLRRRNTLVATCSTTPQCLFYPLPTPPRGNSCYPAVLARKRLKSRIGLNT
eukprot:1875208-Prymnesium_polylepis.1